MAESLESATGSGIVDDEAYITDESLQSPEKDANTTAAADEADVGKEEFLDQGPHDWRKKLKPIQSPLKEDFPSNTELSDFQDGPTEQRLRHGTKIPIPIDDKPDSSKIKDRRFMPPWRKEFLDRKKKSQMTNFGTHGNSKRKVLNLESPFTHQIVNQGNSGAGPGVPRRLKVSPSNSFKVTGGTGSFRKTNQNVLCDSSTNSEVTKKRIAKVQRARLYLLQQTGPNTFLIGGDSPDHKYRVIIGPQTCSCGKGPHCVHLLFIMLRVFQVQENDPLLWNKQLKNYEVETLFRIYQDKRSSLISSKKSPVKSRKPHDETEDTLKEEDLSKYSSFPLSASNSDAGSKSDEEDTCPICLLEMVEGESLLRCENGCQNRLHHHCIAVWFEECRRQTEPLICPLCRAQWKLNNTGAKSDLETSNEQPIATPMAPPNTRAPSPQTFTDNEVRLPYAEPIPAEYTETAQPWLGVLGEELVSCMFSRNWSIRETGVKHLTKEVVAALLRGTGEGRSGAIVSPTRQAVTHSMLECCFSVLAFMCGDPVYKVFVASLRAMRTVISYVPCRDESQKYRLQTLIRPIIDAIILKCSDGTRRTSQLSLSTIMEIARGQEGELAVGREIVNPGTKGIGGLNFVINCVSEEYSLENVQWQWLLGRLYVLDKLFSEFPHEFIPQHCDSNGTLSQNQEKEAEAAASVTTAHGHRLDGEECSALEKLLSISRFAVKAVSYAHSRIERLARRVFFMCVKLTAHLSSTILEFEKLLENVNSKLAKSMKKRLAKIVHDYQLSEQIVEELYHGSNSEPRSGNVSPITSPSHSPPSSPRCNSPVTSHSDCLSEAGSSAQGKNVPTVPPNTPQHIRRKSDSKMLSHDSESSDVDSPDNALSSALFKSMAAIDETVNKTFSGHKRPELQLLDLTACVPENQILDRSQEKPIRPLFQGNDVEEEISLIFSDKDRTPTPCESSQSVQDIKTSTLNSQSLSLICKVCCSKMTVVTSTSAQTPQASEGSLHSASQSHSSILSDDLLEFEDIQRRQSADQSVSFKSEVTGPSPKVSPSHTGDQISDGSDCTCKEEVEKEEAIALARAMDISANQEPRLVVPGLTPTEKEELITIQIQPDCVMTAEMDSDNHYPNLYLENLNWIKGPLIGTGAYSTCYQAQDVKTGVIMAVKQISFCRNSPSEQEKVIETITEEIHLMSRLNHPNIVRILGATRQGCHFNMFVEWMPGGSIAYLLGQYGPFSDNVLANYVLQILRGLAFLHDNNILHRDLKGANLLVDGTGQKLRIGDFGAAARLASQSTGAGEFQGQLLGTVAFMAPEVLRGENYGRACDVWSVGCTIIEMATKNPPWNAHAVSNHLALIFKIATSVEPPPIPENLSPAIRDLTLRCLEQKSEFRPTAKELLLHPLFMHYPKR